MNGYYGKISLKYSTKASRHQTGNILQKGMKR
jgi:hypothetical protein